MDRADLAQGVRQEGADEVVVRSNKEVEQWNLTRCVVHRHCTQTERLQEQEERGQDLTEECQLGVPLEGEPCDGLRPSHMRLPSSRVGRHAIERHVSLLVNFTHPVEGVEGREADHVVVEGQEEADDWDWNADVVDSHQSHDGHRQKPDDDRQELREDAVTSLSSGVELIERSAPSQVLRPGTHAEGLCCCGHSPHHTSPALRLGCRLDCRYLVRC